MCRANKRIGSGMGQDMIPQLGWAGGKLQIKMVGHDGPDLNQLFETLSRWNEELEALGVSEILINPSRGPEMEP